MAAQLTEQEAAWIFTESGGLQQSVIQTSRQIIPGENLGNPQLIMALTADGSNIADWGKWATQTFNSLSGPFQVHFYYNSSTGATNSLWDYKAIFNQGF